MSLLTILLARAFVAIYDANATPTALATAQYYSTEPREFLLVRAGVSTPVNYLEPIPGYAVVPSVSRDGGHVYVRRFDHDPWTLPRVLARPLALGLAASLLWFAVFPIGRLNRTVEVLWSSCAGPPQIAYLIMVFPCAHFFYILPRALRPEGTFELARAWATIAVASGLLGFLLYRRRSAFRSATADSERSVPPGLLLADRSVARPGPARPGARDPS